MILTYAAQRDSGTAGRWAWGDGKVETGVYEYVLKTLAVN